MAEREVNTGWGEQEPHRHDVLTLAKGIDTYFKQAIRDATLLSAQRFDTKEEALEAAGRLADQLEERGEEVETLDRMPVRIVGPDVKVSNIQIEQTDEGVITTTINTETPFVEVGPFGAEPTGLMHMLIPEIDQDDNDKYTAGLSVMFENNKPTTAHISAGALPIADIGITHFVLAPLASTEFIVPVLEQYELRSRALSQVIFRSMEAQPSAIRDALEKLKAAIDDASELNEFIPFEEIEHLHKLAKVTEDHADVATVIDAMRDIFGKDRPIYVKAEAYIGLNAEAEVIDGGGKFIDILPSHAALGVNEPVIVLDASSQLVYVPLSRIESLSF